MTSSSGNMYGGDEVGAVVIDVGTQSVRAGFAGEDSPKCDLPSLVGCCDVDDSQRKLFHGTNRITVPKSGMELKSFTKDGMIEDWDLFESCLDHIYSSELQCQSEEHPLLLSESNWNTKAKRERLCELAFEKYRVPAFFVCKQAVLACFANGKATGLVLDCGASGSHAVPVFDGYVVSHGITRTPLGGEFLAKQVESHLRLKERIDIVPAYQVSSKMRVEDGDAPKWEAKKLPENITDSYRSMQTRDLMQDVMATVLQCADEPYDQAIADTMPTVPYEFPNGCNVDCGYWRFKLPEALFDPATCLAEAGQSSMLSIPHCVRTSIERCDVEIRQSLYSSIVVVGGTSLLKGFNDRLQRDLTARAAPTLRLKLLAATGSAERRFATWIGGSILGSLGTFQQMWLSRQEFEESGKALVEKKCP